MKPTTTTQRDTLLRAGAFIGIFTFFEFVIGLLAYRIALCFPDAVVMKDQFDTYTVADCAGGCAIVTMTLWSIPIGVSSWLIAAWLISAKRRKTSHIEPCSSTISRFADVEQQRHGSFTPKESDL